MNEFEKVVNVLGKKNLENLLVVSCICSAFDYFSGFPNRFPYVFPLVNQKNTTMFMRAIIYSRSNTHRNEQFEPKDSAFVFNNLSVAGDRFDILQNTSLDFETRMAKLFSSFACSQLLFTKNDLKQRVSIKYALYYLIPNKFSDALKEKHKSNFVHIPSAMEQILKINLQTYFALSLMLLLSYKGRYDHFLDPKPEIKKRIESYVNDEDSLNREKEHYLNSLIARAREVSKHIMFLYKQFKPFSRDEINAFLNLTSRDMKQLRQINQGTPFQKGHISERLSPLERYPIVKISPWEYIVPNFRYYDLAITELLRWAFQEIYKRNEFNEVMGTIQELFLLEIIKGNFENLTAIPEKVYKREGSDYGGPDITLIVDDKLIVIEVKAKHITLDTRLSQDSEHFINDLSGAFDALQKLKDEKIPDLYSGLDVYDEYQERLNNTEQNEPICIVVIGEGVYSMQEYLNMYARKNQNFFLSSFKYPYCIIDVIHFCKALDVAKTNNLSLYSLFREYWEVSKNLNPKKHPAEEFGGKQIDWNKSVISSYWEEIINHTKTRLKS